MRFYNPGSVLVAAVFGLGITIGAIKVFAQGSCRNYYRDCPAWSRAGYCVSNRAHFMSLYCKRSCGWCGCADYNTNCYFWSKRGQCALNRRYMSINCRRSCGQCRVNGGWGIWGQWGKCSKSCNTGRQRRFRKCNRPAPANGGKNCVGSFGQQRRCNIQKCANVKIDGAWGIWQSWTTCSKTCGKGIRRRMRKCDRPRPKNGGRYCIGASMQQQFCNILACPTVSPVTATTAPSGSGYTCGLRSTRRIVGGTIASPRDWPWQVGLKRDGNGIIFCGGSLLNREWVLTAAHCIYRNFNPSRSRCVKPNPKLIVVLGEFDVKNVDGHEVHKEVSLMCMYPRYESSTLDYDITLLKLKTPIRRFNEYMRPVCLPQNNTVLRVGQSCYVTGFGRTKEYGQLSSHLREARVPVISSNKCTKLYAGRKVSSRMFCAAHAKGGIDSCKGDSGGPFVCRDIVQPGRWTLMGVVSWGVGCARGDSPGVYAKVSYFVDWINNTMKTA